MTKPVDVSHADMKAAQAAQDAAAEECRAEQFFYGFGSGHAKAVLDKHISRVIQAEREACAQVADAEAKYRLELVDEETKDRVRKQALSAQAFVADRIATAIHNRTSA